jgi:hypothetical protein
MNNASTAEGRGQDGPEDAEPFFPSEGTFKSVVPLSEIGRTPVAPLPAPLLPVNSADVGRPAEAAWAREAHRAEWKEEEETTLVPARDAAARGARQSWVVTAAVITLSVVAGLASGAYLIWSSGSAPEAQRSAQVAAETPALQSAPANTATPTPVAEEVEATAKVEREDKAVEDEKAGEVAKAERSREVARPAPTPRAERSARAAAEAREVEPAPKSARSQSAAAARTRVTTAERRPPAPAKSERTLPVSSPPPSAKSRKVIQWP